MAKNAPKKPDEPPSEPSNEIPVPSALPRRGIRNALKNGSRLNPHRLVVGELPPSMSRPKREGCKYRRDLERQVVDVKGEISHKDAHAIDTATGAVLAAAVCRWLLRNKMEKMSPADIRSCMAEITKMKEKRDAAVRLLELDAKVDVFAAVNVRTKVTDVTEAEDE
jgi:hypothetical protein